MKKRLHQRFFPTNIPKFSEILLAPAFRETSEFFFHSNDKNNSIFFYKLHIFRFVLYIFSSKQCYWNIFKPFLKLGIFSPKAKFHLDKYSSIKFATFASVLIIALNTALNFQMYKYELSKFCDHVRRICLFL